MVKNMYIHQSIYDLDELMRENMHTHSSFSNCAKDEMKLPDMINEAKNDGLVRLAVVDHYNSDNSPEQFAQRNACLRELRESCDSAGIEVFLGNELSAYKIGDTLENQAVRDACDYRLYSANHYHMPFWEIPDDTSPRGFALHAIENLRSLILSDKADCIAHPLISGYIRQIKDGELAFAAYKDNEIGDLMELSNAHQVAWEINATAVCSSPYVAKKLWNIGREVGVVFNFGTDAHRLKNIATSAYSETIKTVLSD